MVKSESEEATFLFLIMLQSCREAIKKAEGSIFSLFIEHVLCSLNIPVLVISLLTCFTEHVFAFLDYIEHSQGGVTVGVTWSVLVQLWWLRKS